MATADAQGPDEWATVTVPIESIEHAALEFLRFGADAEIIEPAELRRRVVDAISELRNLYSPRPAHHPAGKARPIR